MGGVHVTFQALGRHLHLRQLLAADRQAAANSPRQLLRLRTAASHRRRPALSGRHGIFQSQPQPYFPRTNREKESTSSGNALISSAGRIRRVAARGVDLNGNGGTGRNVNMHEKTANLLTRAVSEEVAASHSYERERTVDDEPAVGDSLHYAASEQF